jgi:hypothetical protein
MLLFPTDPTGVAILVYKKLRGVLNWRMGFHGDDGHLRTLEWVLDVKFIHIGTERGEE